MTRTLALILTILPCMAQAAVVSEKQVEACLCSDFERQHRTNAGTFVDCLSDTHAIEIDDTASWQNALGQVLHYSAVTGRKGKIILYCETLNDGLCLKRRLRLEEAIAYHELDIEVEPFSFRDLARCGR